jgi:RHS repeat-associated protein
LYDYDALGNLLKVTSQPSGDWVRYEYDPMGRPVARYEYDAQTAVESYTTGWVWGNQLVEPIAEVDESGVVTARYVYGSRGHVPDYVVKGGETYRIVSDYRGSVRAVVDGEGVVEQRMEYGRWGEVLDDTGPGFQSFGYAGGIWDAETGLVLFGARWYDAGTGRWMSRDPALFGGRQANLYNYVDGAPVTYVDVSGLRRVRDTIPYHLLGSPRFGVNLTNWIGMGLGTVAWLGGGDVSIHDGQVYVEGGGNWNVVELLNLSSATTIGGVVLAEGGKNWSAGANYPHGGCALGPMFGEYNYAAGDTPIRDHEWWHSAQARGLGVMYLPAAAVAWGAQVTSNLAHGRKWNSGTNLLEDSVERLVR